MGVATAAAPPWRGVKRPGNARERLAYLEVCQAQFRCGAPRAPHRMRRVVGPVAITTTAGGVVSSWVTADLSTESMGVGSSQDTQCAVCSAALAGPSARLHLLNPFAQLWAAHCQVCSLATGATGADAAM
jgi:hypothetical protein